MFDRTLRWAALLASVALFLLQASAPAHACGACDEDKVAATYDHAVVSRAAGEGRLVIFCQMDAGLDDRQVQAALHRVPGADAATLRTSQEPRAMSFVLDPRVQTPEAAVSSLNERLGVPARVALLKVM